MQPHTAIPPRILSGLMGAISILGAIAAWQYVGAREPERYLVSAFVLLCSGMIWFLCSAFPKYQLSSREYILIASVLLIGLLLGLLYVFHFCGGECGGGPFCHWDHGYPGRWLRTSGCGDISMLQGLTTPGGWTIDVPGFAADVVFWSGAGVLLLFVRKTIQLSNAGKRP